MGQIFYSTKNSKKQKYCSSISFNINKNKFLDVIYDIQTLANYFLKEGEITYQVKKEIEVLGFINYDFSKWNNTNFKALENKTILYFQDCIFPGNTKFEKGTVIITNPSFKTEHTQTLEFISPYDISLYFNNKNQSVEIITDNIKKNLLLAGKLKKGLICGKMYNVPNINTLTLENTNITLGSVKNNKTIIKNSDVEILYPKRTWLGTKVSIKDSRISTRNQVLDLSHNTIDDIVFEMENSLLEATDKIKLPMGTYPIKTIEKYPTRVVYKNNFDHAIYTDINPIRQDYIDRLIELRRKYTNQFDSKEYVKKK